MENCVACTQTSRILGVGPVVGGLNCWQARVEPWLPRVDCTLNDRADELVSEVCADVDRKILDARVNSLMVDHPREWVNRDGILVLG